MVGRDFGQKLAAVHQKHAPSLGGVALTDTIDLRSRENDHPIGNTLAREVGWMGSKLPPVVVDA